MIHKEARYDIVAWIEAERRYLFYKQIEDEFIKNFMLIMEKIANSE
jgi:hypothetical protein